MPQTLEVEIDENGQVHPIGDAVKLPTSPALLTFLAPSANETALLSEAVLAQDWLKPEEEEAWAYLQPDR